LCLRSEEEFELFQRIDMERRREEAEAGSERKSRLIEESELPDFLTQVPHHTQSASPGSLRSPSSRTSSLRYLFIQ
jgi:hypothetical protein